MWLFTLKVLLGVCGYYLVGVAVFVFGVLYFQFKDREIKCRDDLIAWRERLSYKINLTILLFTNAPGELVVALVLWPIILGALISDELFNTNFLGLKEE